MSNDSPSENTQLGIAPRLDVARVGRIRPGQIRRLCAAWLLCRVILLHEACALAGKGYRLDFIDWQTKFLGVALAQDPSRSQSRHTGRSHFSRETPLRA